MKKLFLLLFIPIFTLVLPAQQFATNFNCNDCSNVNWDLFTELEAGNVVVMCWVMPCSACIPSATINMTTVQSFSASYPGRVKYFLCDDTGNNSCSDITTWAGNAAITADAMFATSCINWLDYGSPSMPKTVVLGGMDHHVYYLQNGEVNNHDVNIAVQNALAETGVDDHNNTFSGLGLFPNPATTNGVELCYTLIQPENIIFEIQNPYGVKISRFVIGDENPGKHEHALDLSMLSNGIYLIKLNVGNSSQTIKFIVAQ